MKRTKLKKKGKQKISIIQRKLWELCKQVIRMRHGNICYTCHTTGLSGSNWHTGHLFPKASVGAYLKYDLRILRPQCYNCNINHGGRGADFYARMLKEIGQEKMEELQRDRIVIVKAYDHYISLIPKYEEILMDLNNKKFNG
jgi:hypothetical protein